MTAPTMRWPYPRDSPLARARRVALAYRAALGAANRAQRDRIDEIMTGYGETWVREVEVTVDADGMEAITTAEAAALVHVEEWVIRHWAAEAHPHDPGRKLLPRFRRQGRSMTYLTRDVLAAADIKNGHG